MKSFLSACQFVCLIALSVVAGCAQLSQAPLSATPLSAPASDAGFRPNSIHAGGTGIKRQGIAVTDYSNSDVVVFNSAYTPIRTITQGINQPIGDVYDASRRLYVANSGGNDVTEYSRNGKLIYTYSYGTTGADAVALDGHGRLYVASSSGTVLEFVQRSNSPIAQCTAPIAAYGIAVDSSGDVFVDGGQYDTAQLIEYPGGLTASACQSTALGVRTNDGTLSGMTMDREADLVISDPPNHVLIVAPPYSSISSSLSFLLNTSVSLNKNNAIMFVAEPAAGKVSVNAYPSGSQITTIGSSEGLSEPMGVATFAYYDK